MKTPHNENHENSLLRVQGFKDGLKHHGISLTEDHIIGVELSLDDSIFDAEGHINSLLARGVEFDGIFAITDRFALGALYALKKHGIQVPEQVKVIGFDNSIYSMISQPSISTVDRNIEGMALAACNKLFQLIESDNKIDNSTIIIPSKIIERSQVNDLEERFADLRIFLNSFIISISFNRRISVIAIRVPSKKTRCRWIASIFFNVPRTV